MPRRDSKDGPNGSARQEAERLIAAALAAASFAARANRRRDGRARDRDTGRAQDGPFNDWGDDLAGLVSLATRFLGDNSRSSRDTRQQDADDRGYHFATGSEECCVCPVCRAVAMVRDPSPEFAERVATGASSLAGGLVSVLRAVGEMTRRPQRPAGPDGMVSDGVVSDGVVSDGVGDGTAVAEEEAGEADSAAGRSPGTGGARSARSDFGNVWQAATRAAVDEPDFDFEDGPVSDVPMPPKKPMAKKAVAKKAVAKKAVAPEAVAPEAVADKAVAKKAVASKAVAPEAVADKAKAKKAAKKAVVPETVVDKAAAKKAVTKKAAKKSTAKKSGAKKAVAPEAVKKSGAKKAVAPAATTPAALEKVVTRPITATFPVGNLPSPGIPTIAATPATEVGVKPAIGKKAADAKKAAEKKPVAKKTAAKKTVAKKTAAKKTAAEGTSSADRPT